MKRFTLITGLAVAIISAVFVASVPTVADEKKPVANIEVEIKREGRPAKMGDIVIELYPDKAPKTVENFIQYAKDGFYNGTIFHRVIDGFMIQGGGFQPGMVQKPTREPIVNEADNGLKNQVGTIAMARTQDINSATAQFFINVKDNDFLNHRYKSPRGYGYAVFGKVIKGMNMVHQIKKVDTTTVGHFGDVPKADVIIRSITIQ